MKRVGFEGKGPTSGILPKIESDEENEFSTSDNSIDLNNLKTSKSDISISSAKSSINEPRPPNLGNLNVPALKINNDVENLLPSRSARTARSARLVPTRTLSARAHPVNIGSSHTVRTHLKIYHLRLFGNIKSVRTCVRYTTVY
jgi:hypothetical protein